MLTIFKSMPQSALARGLQDVLKRITDGEGGGKEILGEICWVESGSVLGPVGLDEMTAEENEVSTCGPSVLYIN